MKQKLKFGDYVLCTSKLSKVKHSRKTSWDTHSFNETGIFLGWRTLREGYSVQLGYDEGGWGFRITRTIKAALVAIEKHNPIYVPAESIFPLIEELKEET